MYTIEDFGVEIVQTVYALDSTAIDLCLSVFPWVKFRHTKSAIKPHSLLDLRGSIPSFIHISEGKRHDVNILDLLPESGVFYIMDRGYLDFERLSTFSQCATFYVIRAKSGLQFRWLYSHPVDKSTGLRCDQTIVLTGFCTHKRYPEKLRRIKYYDTDTDRTLLFLTNNFTLPALTITRLYRCQWQVELFFKWIKQHLRIKYFYGRIRNAVKTQIWIAVSVYVLVATIKKRLHIDAILSTILQILSIAIFERSPLLQLLTETDYTPVSPVSYNQFNLFD